MDRVVLLSTGDELLCGAIADTNAQWLSGRFFELGLEVVAVLTVGDEPERLRWAWRTALELGDLVISTGGIGPTSDDLTTETVAAVLGCGLRFDEPSADRIRQMFAAMRRPMPENNLKQAFLPEGAVVVENPLGTAPGYRASPRWGEGAVAREVHLFVLPGVPREMKRMFTDTVEPWVRAQRGSGLTPLVQTFQTFGMSESALDEEIAAIIQPGEARIGFRASFPKIAVKLLVKPHPGESTAAAEARLGELAGRVRERLGGVVYGEGEMAMEEAVARALAARGARLALAESCTGGLIGHRLTEVPGISAHLLADYVVYSNAAKSDLLGVRQETLVTYGAVSEETAREMAEGARTRSGADVAIGVTGIAGPEGGSRERPVGTVCFALATAEGVVSRRHQLWGTRDWVKLLASQFALDMLRRWALGHAELAPGFRR